MNLYKSLIRPILFFLEPETAQKFSEFALKKKFIWKISKNLFEYDSELLETNLAGIHLTNPIGLAAGFDKDCQLLSSLETFGFGYLTGGTITREARPGNAQPRMLRLNSQNGLIIQPIYDFYNFDIRNDYLYQYLSFLFYKFGLSYHFLNFF